MSYSTIQYLEHPYIIGIAETWFKAVFLKNLCSYKLYSLDMTNGKRGVALYIHNDNKYFEFLFPFLIISEQEWCQIHIGNEWLLVGCIYRPPFSNQGANITSIILSLLQNA